MKTLSLMFALLLLFLIPYIHGYKILYLMPLASRSHRNVFDPLILELAKRDHQLTVISPYSFAEPQKNVKEIIIEQKQSLNDPKIHKEFLKLINYHPLVAFYTYKYYGLMSCESYLMNPEVKELIKKGKQFDLVIVSSLLNDCALATGTIMGKYIIKQSSAVIPSWDSTFVPRPMSYVPNLFLPYTSNMNFFQRLDNAITAIGNYIIYNYDQIPAVQNLVSKYVPENPSIKEALKKPSFTLTNSDPVITTQRPTMPNIVDVGGMHCRKAKPLPKELEDFVSSSGEHGFIYFSLGSNAQSRYLPEETKKGLLEAFSQLKQKVIWKYEEDMPNSPSNIKVTKWAPQQDILGHSKIRVFITHGGMLSLQESVYHNVPVVAVPLFGDQPSNVARVVELGIGVKVDYNNISGNSMYEAVTKIIHDKSFAENMKKYSAIFREHQKESVDTAAYWVEYVVRYEGASHLRSPGEKLNFIQYYLIDVISFVATVLFLVLFSIYRILKTVTMKICYKNKPKQKLQ